MSNDMVIIQNIFIKLTDGKQYKSIIFIHNGKLESIRIPYIIKNIKVGDKIRYKELKSLEV